MNREKRWTSGPWDYDPKLADNGAKQTAIYSCSDETELCEPVAIIPHDDMTVEGYKEVQANARLLVKTTEMADAIEDMLNVSTDGEYTEVLVRMRRLLNELYGDERS